MISGEVLKRLRTYEWDKDVVPGILAMTVLFAATFIGISVLWDRQIGYLKVTLVAPVPS